MLNLKVSTLQGPELHLDVSALQRSVLLLEVSATGPEMHLDVSALQRCVLLHEVSATRARAASGRVCTTEECTTPGGVCHRAWAASGRVCTTEECTTPRGVCHRARAASGRVCTAEVCDASGGVYIMEAWAASEPKLWIEKTNDLVDIETNISRNLKGLVAIKIATAVRKKSLAAVETAIWFFKTQPRRERELDR